MQDRIEGPARLVPPLLGRLEDLGELSGYLDPVAAAVRPPRQLRVRAMDIQDGLQPRNLLDNRLLDLAG